MENSDDSWPNKAQHVIDTYGGNLVKSAIMVAAFHPCTVVRVLVQVGHEPIAPVKSEQWFPTKKAVWCYPNVFKYMGHITREKGYGGLYTALAPRLLHDLVNKTVGNALLEHMKDGEEEEEDGDSVSVAAFAQETMKLACVKTASYVISYPFHVISVRMIAQFAGGASDYTSTMSSLREIYREEGVGGFFKGVIPGLVGELVMLSVFRVINRVIRAYLLTDELKQVQDMKVASSSMANYCANMCAQPFQVVANVMCVNDTELNVGKPPFVPVYEHWTECWSSLGAIGRNRGSSLLRRTLPYHSI